MSSVRFLKSTWLLGLITMAIVIPITMMILESGPPYEIKSGYTVPPELRRGQPYRVDWVIYNYPKTCTGLSYRFMRDSNGKVWVLGVIQASFGNIPATKNETLRVSGVPRLLDMDVPLGRIELFGFNEHFCNVIQRILQIPIKVPYGPIISTVIE